MPEIPLGGSFYKLDASLPISAQECVNLYSNIPEVTTPSKKQLLIPDGIKLATTAGGEVFNRGSHVFNGKPYFVQGPDLYRIDQSIDGFGAAAYTAVKVNTSVTLPGTERVIMADNGEEGGQLMIVTPASDAKFNAYIYTVAGALVAVSDSDFDGPVSCVRYVDGYFLFTKKNGQKFFISDLRDGAAYISTDFERSEADPDFVQSAFIIRNQPFIWGKQTIQGYQNVGGTGFPFVYIQGSVQSKGLASIYGLVEESDRVVFLGGGENESPSMWITNGSDSEKLSTIAIEQEISTYSQNVIESCFTWQYSRAGAEFIAFTFPGQSCFVFDFRSGEWHTRESVNNMGDSIPCRISSIADCYGVLLVGDVATNKIGVLDRNTFTEYGEQIQRRFVTPHIDNEGMPFFINSVELVSKTGAGLTSGQGSNPTVSLSISYDGGRTFSNRLERSIGRIGEYNKRTIWNQLGRVSREVCFKFEMSDPISWAFTKAEVNFE
jgi:hypothetical protein